MPFCRDKRFHPTQAEAKACQKHRWGTNFSELSTHSRNKRRNTALARAQAVAPGAIATPPAVPLFPISPSSSALQLVATRTSPDRGPEPLQRPDSTMENHIARLRDNSSITDDKDPQPGPPPTGYGQQPEAQIGVHNAPTPVMDWLNTLPSDKEAVPPHDLISEDQGESSQRNTLFLSGGQEGGAFPFSPDSLVDLVRRRTEDSKPTLPDTGPAQQIQVRVHRPWYANENGQAVAWATVFAVPFAVFLFAIVLNLAIREKARFP